MVFLCVVCVRLLALVSCYHQRCCVCSSPTVQFWSSLSDYFPMFSKKETLSLEKSFWTWKILFSWFWAHHGTSSTFLSQHLHGIDKTQSFFFLHFWNALDSLLSHFLGQETPWMNHFLFTWMGMCQIPDYTRESLESFCWPLSHDFLIKTLDEATPQTFLNLPWCTLVFDTPQTNHPIALRLTYLWKWIRSTFCKEL